MRIFDVSMLIEENMMVYKNKEEKKPSLYLVKEILEDGINESVINMNLHTGTHIDAPYHMQSDGETIENLELRNLITKCHVFDLTNVKDGIKKTDLTGFNIKEGDFVLFKTQNSFSEVFLMDFIYLAKSGAEYLVEKKIAGVGIDSLGIERDQPNHDTHKILFQNKIIIIEGLRLKEIDEGEYQIIALPLKIKGADGAPARVVLVEEITQF
ncbi:MAG: cyclase family protein [Tissierellia bacterium]|nr:cyclase family protein [Tissierellia bacterium]